MKSFYWDINFVTGFANVDEQHKHLVDIINQLGNILTENKIKSDEIENIFKALADYTIFHFQEEEMLMGRVSIDPRHLKHHIKAHKYFLNEVTSMRFNLSLKKNGLEQDLFDFLNHWLAYHILGEDQNMARQITAIESGIDPEEAYEAEERQKDNATKPLLIALKKLFELVSSRNRELVRLNQSLEEKVEKRTRALSDANLHLDTLSRTDLLTGLPNRRHAMRTLSGLWDESVTNGSPLVCMIIDADHFKIINDTYGHDAGDIVLIELANTLTRSFRNDDIVCRLGGDEFLVICPNTTLEGGMYIAEITRKIISALRVPTGGEPWKGSISIGVAPRTPQMKSCEDLIKMADKGVYAAKENGKNCVKTVLK